MIVGKVTIETKSNEFEILKWVHSKFWIFFFKIININDWNEKKEGIMKQIVIIIIDNLMEIVREKKKDVH